MKLQIKDDAGRVTVVSIANKQEITIGRKEGNTLRLTERNVSRRHARLVKAGDEVTLEDLSRYGTRVNGQRVRGSRKVGTGDIIQIGDYELALDGARQVEAPPTPAAGPAKAAKAPPSEADLKRQKELEAAARAQIAAAKAEASRQEGRREATTSVQALDDGARDDADRQSLGAGRKRIVGAQPSLVIVSDELAGKTFLLADGTTILGRSGECGLVIDHNSVSGNHARLAVEAGVTRIFDLKSKNGVRINGELWEESTLKAGDIVEIGKVRLRYVGPGEEFVFQAEAWRGGVFVGREAAPPEPSVVGPETAAPRRGLWLVLLVLLAAGGAAAYFLTRPKPVSNTTGPVTVKASTAAASPDKAAPADPTAPASRKAEAVPDGDEAISGALSKAREAAASQRWDEALRQLEAVVALDRDHKEALALRDTVTREREVGAKLDLATNARKDGDPTGAWFTLEELGPVAETSFHAARAKTLRSELLPEVVTSYLEMARGLLDGKQYVEAAQKAEQILALQADHAEAKELLAKARKARGEAAKGEKATATEAVKDADALYAEAKVHHNSNPDKALALYREAADKGKAVAWKHIAGLRSKKNDRAGATAAYETYLKLVPNAPDAETVRDVLKKWRGE